MIIVEDMKDCLELVGKKIKFENIVYKITKFNVNSVGIGGTKHYIIEILDTKIDMKHYLFNKEIRPFFQKCELID